MAAGQKRHAGAAVVGEPAARAPGHARVHVQGPFKDKATRRAMKSGPRTSSFCDVVVAVRRIPRINLEGGAF